MTTNQPGLQSLEDLVGAYEKDWLENENILIDDYLPEPDSDEFVDTLTELIRSDLEFRWEQANPDSERSGLIKKYLNQFPQIRDHAESFASILFEEYRLRSMHKASEEDFEIVSPEEYQKKYEIDVSSWPVWNDEKPTNTNVSQELLSSSLPFVGQEVCGFRLIGMLGEGACGKVFLARQNDLANRLVCLKVTKQATRESVLLCQLQHTNVVSVFSTHQHDGLNAICMPFLGMSTLKDLLENVFRERKVSAASSISTQMLVATVARSRAETILETITSESDRVGFRELISGVSISSKEVKESKRQDWQDLCLEISIRVAEGLNHAHSHGVIHGDLKPANILMSDEGQPVLLDFHLAQSVDDFGKSEVVGGTLAYMSPQQLMSLRTGKTLSPESDIFSFGTILFEMLTGNPLWSPEFGKTLDETIDREHAARSCQKTIDSRLASQFKSIDLRRIIQNCLSPPTGNRYSSSRQLLEDLMLHQRDLPLRHAKGYSFSERMRKWANRHPRIASASSVFAVAAMVIGILAMVLFNRSVRLAKTEALHDSQHFVEQLQNAKLDLSVITDDLNRIEKSRSSAEKILKRFDALSLEQLEGSARHQNVSLAMQDLEKRTVANVHFWIAESLRRKLVRSSEKSNFASGVLKALEFNKEARQFLGPKNRWKGLEIQRALLLKMSGAKSESTRVMEYAQQLKVSTKSDQFMSSYLQQYDPGQSSEVAKALVAKDPLDYSNWILSGNIYSLHNELAEAEAAFSIASSLVPEEKTAHYSIGRVNLEMKDYQGAIKAFDRVLQLDPETDVAYLNKGLALEALGKMNEAEVCYSKAIDLGTEHTRAWYLRWLIRTNLGDDGGAKADFETFIRSEPNDHISYVTRGAVLLQDDADLAIADFERALEINPRSNLAYQNLAYVYSEVKNDLESAIEAMDRLVKIEGSATAIATRGVLVARAKERNRAHEDAETALRLSQSADTKYRVAGIYSLTSSTNKEDEELAISLLREACLLNPKVVYGYIFSDKDLDPIRENQEFKELVQILEVLNQGIVK